MFKSKKMILLISVIALVAVVSGTIFAYFVAPRVQGLIGVKAGVISVCPMGTFKDIQNALPGTVNIITKTEDPMILNNSGTRDIICQVNFNDFITVYLSQKPPQNFIDAGDYVFDQKENKWKMSQQRTKQIASIEFDHQVIPNMIKLNNNYYVAIDTDHQAEFGQMTVNISPELGGNDNGSVNRPFEQNASIKAGSFINYVQNSMEPAELNFGTTDVSQLPPYFFD